jgi:hypothetical protein
MIMITSNFLESVLGLWMGQGSLHKGGGMSRMTGTEMSSPKLFISMLRQTSLREFSPTQTKKLPSVFICKLKNHLFLFFFSFFYE